MADMKSGKDDILTKLKHFIIPMFIILTLMGMITCLAVEKANKAYIDEGRVRILISGVKSQLEKSIPIRETQLTYAVLSLSGKVLVSTMSDYKANETIDLNTAHFLLAKNQISLPYAYYSSPLLTDGTQDKLLLVKIPVSSILSHSNHSYLIYLIILFILFAFLLLLRHYQFLKKDILLPLEQIHESTQAIQNEDFTVKVLYDYDGEIGELCHDFELMRDQLEAARKQTALLEQNEQLLLACISHDLKTPLSAIYCYVEGIHNGLVKDEEGIKRYARTILSKVTMLSKLIDDILEHSKSQMNEFSIQPAELYTREYLTGLFQELSLDIKQKGLTFTLEKIPDVLVCIDQSRITQVIQNIIYNSIKYTEPGGEIKVHSLITDNKLILSISDTGQGIGVEDLPFIFNKFYRSEKARTLNVAGSGLGLSIAKNIIIKHNGTIQCDSLLGEGTTISFSLPLC